MLEKPEMIDDKMQSHAPGGEHEDGKDQLQDLGQRREVVAIKLKC